jgi:hypothetical protein
MNERTYVVAQLGARMHYAVPRILQEARQLERFYTDICAVRGWPKLLNLIPPSVRPSMAKRLLSRAPAGVDPDRIIAFNAFGYKYAKRRASVATRGRFLVHLWAGEQFCRHVLKEGFGRAGGAYTFNTAGLEILQRCKNEGVQAVTEQTILPMRLELGLLIDEAARYPGWEVPTDNAGASTYCDREEQEWKVADVILCSSEFVRDGIARCGGPIGKCVLVPYGVDLPVETVRPGQQILEVRDKGLRVLTVGSVGLRKGAPYVLEAARRLKGKAQFRLVGNIAVSRMAEAQLREHLELTGPAPRSDIARHFAWADVFLLPSLCEGSATVIYEALAYGLPVICTPNTGSVVRDNVDGFVIPMRDPEAITERLMHFVDSPELLETMGRSARERAKDFTIAKYGGRLRAALSGGGAN